MGTSLLIAASDVITTTTSIVLDYPIEEVDRTPLPLLALITAILIGMFFTFILLTRTPRIPRDDNQQGRPPHPRSDSWWNL